MGKTISKVKHPFRNFNLENRAHKVISESTPTPAPKHLKDEMDINRMKEKYPEIFEEGLKKHEQLDKHLRDVYVVSHDPQVVESQEKSSRPLPQDRSQHDPFLFGHKEPDKIPLGKTTLRNALKFISQHQTDPVTYSVARIAEEHKLPEDITKNILKYFRVFEVYIPDQETKTKAKFAGPSIPKVVVIEKDAKQLPLPAEVKNKEET